MNPVNRPTAGLQAANEVYKLPPRLWDARCKACWFLAGILVLVVASFWSLNLKWAQFFSTDALERMGKFVAELLRPEFGRVHVGKVVMAALETLAMSALGTLLAVVLGLALALPASKTWAGDPARWRGVTRLLLNGLRSTPELVWAAQGLGLTVLPLPGPSALLLALAASGLNGQRFAFEGYLPVDAAERAARIRALDAQSARWQQTQIVIETPYRNQALLSALVQQLLPDSRLAVASGLSLPQARCRTMSVQAWRQLQATDPAWLAQDLLGSKLPAVFSWLAR